jgi:hypothetical protein
MRFSLRENAPAVASVTVYPPPLGLAEPRPEAPEGAVRPPPRLGCALGAGAADRLGGAARWTPGELGRSPPDRGAGWLTRGRADSTLRPGGGAEGADRVAPDRAAGWLTRGRADSTLRPGGGAEGADRITREGGAAGAALVLPPR